VGNPFKEKAPERSRKGNPQQKEKNFCEFFFRDQPLYSRSSGPMHRGGRESGGQTTRAKKRQPEKKIFHQSQVERTRQKRRRGEVVCRFKQGKWKEKVLKVKKVTRRSGGKSEERKKQLEKGSSGRPKKPLGGKGSPASQGLREKKRPVGSSESAPDLKLTGGPLRSVKGFGRKKKMGAGKGNAGGKAEEETLGKHSRLKN